MSPISLPQRLRGMGVVVRWERTGARVSMGTVKEKQTLKGGGALELLDLRLLEDGGERGGALGSDVIVRDAASEG